MLGKKNSVPKKEEKELAYYEKMVNGLLASFGLLFFSNQTM